MRRVETLPPLWHEGWLVQRWLSRTAWSLSCSRGTHVMPVRVFC
ncbi:hypothetical protein SXCC_02118 [Gluconacetobacter sp. SXCC-1]|nr:hypothetical protein SXCC_02118 [Gluconacetobacter sp. SXCC-1]